MNGSCALTTFDNPYNPFEQFSDWFLFDVEKGYNTCAYLRIELLTLLTNSLKKRTIKRLKERLTRSFVTTS